MNDQEYSDWLEAANAVRQQFIAGEMTAEAAIKKLEPDETKRPTPVEHDIGELGQPPGKPGLRQNRLVAEKLHFEGYGFQSSKTEYEAGNKLGGNYNNTHITVFSIERLQRLVRPRGKKEHMAP